MNLSFSPLQTPTGQTTLGRIVKQSGLLKIHVSRDYSESFNGFPVVASSLNENRKFTFIPLYLAGNVTMNGTVPTAHIAVLTQRHSYATIHIGIFNNKKHPSVWGFLGQNHVQWGSDGVYGNRPCRGKFGSPCVFSHGRWSPRSRDLGARSSSMFSTRHPIPFLPLSPCVSASPRQKSPPPPHPGSPPACNTTLLSPGCARSTEHPPRLQIGLSFLTPTPPHPPLLSLCWPRSSAPLRSASVDFSRSQ